MSTPTQSRAPGAKLPLRRGRVGVREWATPHIPQMLLLFSLPFCRLNELFCFYSIPLGQFPLLLIILFLLYSLVKSCFWTRRGSAGLLFCHYRSPTPKGINHHNIKKEISSSRYLLLVFAIYLMSLNTMLPQQPSPHMPSSLP